MLTLKKFKKKVNRFVWDRDLHSLSLWQMGLIRALRTIQAVFRDLTQGQLSLQAMSLVYTTLLSLVPLLAVSFSMLKGLGVHNQIEPFLLNFLAPMGEKGTEITAQIIGFVENVNVSVLGSVGLIFLLYTIISLTYKIEMVFNFIWHVKQLRPFVQRFSDYLSVIIIGPMLMFFALGTTDSVKNSSFFQEVAAIKLVGLLIDSTTSLVPYLFIIGAFTFVYIFVPNTRIRFRSALLGAVVAGSLWQTIGWGFAAFIVSSTQYAAVYSGFAILIIFMIWLYLAWLILLVGSSIAFYHQHPEYLNETHHGQPISNRLKERLALLSMYLIAKTHFQGGKAWTGEKLAKHFGVPTETLKKVLAILEEHGLLIRAGNEISIYVPARAPQTISLKEILDIIRMAEENKYFNAEKLPLEEKVRQLIADIEIATEQALKERTLRNLVLDKIHPNTEV